MLICPSVCHCHQVLIGGHFWILPYHDDVKQTRLNTSQPLMIICSKLAQLGSFSLPDQSLPSHDHIDHQGSCLERKELSSCWCEACNLSSHCNTNLDSDFEILFCLLRAILPDCLGCRRAVAPNLCCSLWYAISQLRSSCSMHIHEGERSWLLLPHYWQQGIPQLI